MLLPLFGGNFVCDVFLGGLGGCPYSSTSFSSRGGGQTRRCENFMQHFSQQCLQKARICFFFIFLPNVPNARINNNYNIVVLV